jgi:molybdenum cofactor cytidylyltransferase
MSLPVVAGIILAAGASSRMGNTKALLSAHSRTFVSRSARTMISGGVDTVIVVASVAADRIRAALATELPGHPIAVVENPNWTSGQLSSLIVGLDVVAAGLAAGALVCPVDMPLFSAGTVARVIEAFRTTGALVVRPASGGRHGHPVLFSRALFDELRGADPETGARPVVRAHVAQTVDVEVDDPGAFIDIDTPEDYARWIARESGPPGTDDDRR